MELEKDPWPGEYFGFGNILLPKTQGQVPLLVFSSVAVKEWDYFTFVTTKGGSV
jgi:ethanolamine utilization protein EutA (predicted chaperonin)